jgi:EAL domain-containing protein (putative c-di-GMP-specific phosphodiesterase class I)
MYHAKRGGANRYAYFSRPLNQRVNERFEIENGLLDALSSNSLRLHFQPQVDVALGIATGAEALVRWRHPERGLIPPSDFIPYAEEAGLISLLGQWVLQAACEQAVRWPAIHGRRLEVSVNVSSRQLCDDGFPEIVMRTLRETDLHPARLTVEITEHSVLQDAGLTLAAVRFLRDLGARVVVDDFGTGYSAISALKTLPIDGIKIDRSFVADILESSIDATITEGLISIARGLGLSVTAEGVETRDQLRLLPGLGVNHMQGYLFGKPVESEVFVSEVTHGPDVWVDELPDA